MNDYMISWSTERGVFRVGNNYSDNSKRVARELITMGALGVQVYNHKRERIVFERGDTEGLD